MDFPYNRYEDPLGDESKGGTMEIPAGYMSNFLLESTNFTGHVSLHRERREVRFKWLLEFFKPNKLNFQLITTPGTTTTDTPGTPNTDDNYEGLVVDVSAGQGELDTGKDVGDVINLKVRPKNT